MFCENCGREIPDHCKFCSQCGTAVGEASERPIFIPAAPAKKGYLSEEAKKKYTIIVGILGIAFFFGQFAFPVIFMFGFMSKSFMNMGEISVSRGAYYDGEIFLIRTAMAPSSKDNKSLYSLCSLTPSSKKLPKDFCKELDIDNPRALAGNDRLWLIGDRSIGYYKDGELKTIPVENPPGDTTKPFLYNEQPAMVENRIDGLYLITASFGQWRDEKKIEIDLSMRDGDTIKNYIQVVSIHNELYFFRELNGSLYMFKGIPGDTPVDWKEVCSLKGNFWSGTVISGYPAVLYSQNYSDGKRLSLMVFANEKWVEVLARKAGSFPGYAAFQLEDQSKIAVIASLFPDGFKTIIYEDGIEFSTTKYGNGFMAGSGMIKMMMLMYVPMLFSPILLSIILSLIMNTSRVCDYRCDELRLSVPFASLSRRALAQLIDLPLMIGFVIFGYYNMFNNFGDMETMQTDIFQGFGFVFGGILWVFIMLLVFSFTEGKWGLTPGKLVVGIKALGTDLKPCGFGRGLIRNILMFADGIFNWMVGIMLVAYTEDWQRVGDMAARTVVVRNVAPLPLNQKQL